MTYFIKTLGQLPLLLKAFRKEKGLTQAAMAERLGITQQGYAHFEANPRTATLERLFLVLRLLDVEIGLTQTAVVNEKKAASPGGLVTVKVNNKRKVLPTGKAKPSTPTRKKESW